MSNVEPITNRDLDVIRTRLSTGNYNGHREDDLITPNDLRGVLAEIDRMRAAQSQLVEFARWAVRYGPWEGGHIDGGDIQEKAETLGLIIKTKYDPAIHGQSDEAEPGDDWYVFGPALETAALTSHEPVAEQREVK